MLSALQERRDEFEAFLRAERELLVRAGLPDGEVEELVEKCRTVVLERQYNDRKEVGEVLTELRDYVCVAGPRLDGRRRSGVLAGARDAFAGTLITVLNGGLLAQTVGISGAAAAGSMVIGGTVASNGLAEIKRWW